MKRATLDLNIHTETPHLLLPAQSGGGMSHLMKLAEVLRDIAEECSKSETEQALALCMGFADRVSGEPEDPAGYPEPLGLSIVTKCSRLPN